MTEKKERRKGREGERGRERERKGESLSSVVFKYSQKYLNAEGHAKIFCQFFWAIIFGLSKCHCDLFSIFMPQWVEPPRHVVVSHVCDCMSFMPVSLQLIMGKC